MKKWVKQLIVIDTIITFVVVFLILNHVNIETQLQEHLQVLPVEQLTESQKILTKSDIQDFPGKIQEYIAYCKLLGKPQVRNVTFGFKGQMRLSQTGPWLPVETVQYNYPSQPTRIFIIKASMYGITMAGHDIYQNHAGNMRGRLLKLFTIFDEYGQAFDIGELTTFLNDTLLLYPAGLVALKDRLTWREHDDGSLMVSLVDGSNTVSAQLYFGEQGQLINYVTTDRFVENPDKQAKKKYIQMKWSTPIESYKELQDRMIIDEAQAIWHFPKGNFSYAKFKLQKIMFNITSPADVE